MYAGTAEDEYQQYRDDGYLIVGLMIMGDADVQLWVDTYDLTFPLLADTWFGGVASEVVGLDGEGDLHALVGRDMTVRVYRHQPNATDIEAALAEPWPEVDRPRLPGNGDEDESTGDQTGVTCSTGGSRSAVKWSTILAVLAWHRRLRRTS